MGNESKCPYGRWMHLGGERCTVATKTFPTTALGNVEVIPPCYFQSNDYKECPRFAWYGTIYAEEL